MRTTVWCTLALTAVLVAGQARAVSFETAYTIAAPFSFDTDGSTYPGSGAEGTIDPVDPLFINNGLDANDTVCLAGACDIPNQDWVVFSVNVTNSAVDEIRFGLQDLPLRNALGIGYFLEGGLPIASYGADLSVPDTPRFTFSGGGLSGVSRVLFVAYADGTFPFTPNPPFDGLGDGAGRFMVSETGQAPLSDGYVNVTEPVQVVPEPGTALLLGLGLAGLAARRRQA